MRRVTSLLIAALCIATPSSILVAQSPQLTPFRGLIDHVSADQWGGTYATGEVWHHAISGDGRYVVMTSPSDLVGDPYDSYGDDVFLRDRSTGTITRISMPPYGGSTGGMSGQGTISANGRHVAYASGGSLLVDGDTNNHWDVFVRDLDQETTVRVSVATDGTEGDQDSLAPSISADGRFVAFLSWATTFAPGVPMYSARQAYLHDRDADADGVFDEPGEVTTELISVGPAGDIADYHVEKARVATDGRVLFESTALNLLAGGSNGFNHLYLRDRAAGQTTLIDRGSTGFPSSWGVSIGTSDMSDDGRFITFSSISQDIVPFDMNWQSQVFLYDTVGGPAATQIVSKLADGTVADGSSYATAVSGDGRYVLFTTAAYNLASPAPTGAAGPAALVVRDMTESTFARVDVLDDGTAFDQADYYMTPGISADGTAIVLSSRANNALVNGYSNWQFHTFVLTAMTMSPMSASFPMAGGSGSFDVDTSSVTGFAASTSDQWITIEGYSAPYAVHFTGPSTVHFELSENSSGIARDGTIRVGLRTIAIHQEGDGDPTPPVITPIVTGTQVNGWYTSDVTVSFEISDPESEIVYIAPGCAQTFTLTTDGIASVLCEATSHGGTASLNLSIPRDTTPPTVWISYPRTMIFPYGSHVDPYYACFESLSPVTSCVGPSMATPLDTWTRGRHSFTVTGTDEAGNTATQTVDYIVGTDQCISTPLAPAKLKGWWMLDGNLRESIGGVMGTQAALGTFPPGVAGVGQSWDNRSAGNYFGGLDAPSALAAEGLTVSFWIAGRGVFIPNQYGTIVYNPLQYHIAEWIDGTIRWAFNQSGTYTWVNTGIVLPYNSWAHIAVTYKDGVVKTYLNGKLAHSQALSQPLGIGASTQGVQIGGRIGVPATLQGSLDDIMIFNDAMSASEVDSLALAGSGGLCTIGTQLTVSSPQTVTFGNAFGVSATLTDQMGAPIANRRLRLVSAVSPAQYTFDVVTDNNGSVIVNFPIRADVPVGLHPNGITVEFAGDEAFAAAQYQADVTVMPGTPLVYWEPETLTYGTPLGAAQQNAVSMPGTYVYWPNAGTILGAGIRTLSVTISPDDPHYAQHTVYRTIVVNKAAPTIEMPTVNAVYTGLPQTAAPVVRGAGGAALTPFTILYNGSPNPPVNAGTYSIEVQFAGDSNHLPVSATGSFTIDKATPTMTATGGEYTFDNHVHVGTGTAIGVRGESLGPVPLTYNGTPFPPIEAGVYLVRSTYEGSSNYNAAESAPAEIRITRATPTVDFQTMTVTYTGNQRTPVLFVRGVDGTSLCCYTWTFDGSAVAPTNAGTYALVVRYAGSNNYEPITANTSFVIAKALPIFPVLNNLTATYDGYAHSRVFTVKGVQNETLTPLVATYNGSPTQPVNAGVYVAIVRYDGSANYSADSRTYTITIDRARPGLAWTPSTFSYGTALGAAQLNATASVPGTFVYDPPAGTVLYAGPQWLFVTFTPNDTANYQPESDVQFIQVAKATPQLTWAPPAAIPFGTPLSAAQLTATSNIPGTFVYNRSAGTVLSAGQWTLSATFTPDDTWDYNNGSISTSLTVVKATPVLTWNAPPDIVYGTALSGAQLNATGSVPGTFVYSPAAGAVLNAGPRTLSVTFTPTNTSNYNSTTATVTLNVAKAAPAITWTNPADIVYGTSLGASQLNATANVAGTFSYSPAAGAVLNAGTQTLSVTFTPANSANYSVATATVPLTVTKVTPWISWLRPMNIVYGTPLGATQLNATAQVPGTFTYSPAAGTVLPAGTDHILHVDFTPDDAVNYSAASFEVRMIVDKAAPVVSWNTPAAITYGTALSASQLNATANVPGTFSYSPASGTVLNAGSQTLALTFTPDDASNYSAASASVALNVAKAATTINWSNPAAIVYGTALSATQLNASANVPGTFSYSPAAGAVLNAGTQTLSVTFTPSDSTNYSSATADASIVIAKANPVVTWASPVAISYGTALSATQLNATANVPGTFSYSPAAGTALNAGSQTLSLTFTPDDASNYSAATASVPLTVAKAASTITWPNPSSIVYGAALSASQLNATANVPGTFSYSPAAGAVLNAGNQTLSVTFTPSDSTNYSSATANASIVIAKANPVVTWASPAGINYGTALSATQLNASANVPGTYSYSPAAGTVLGAGSQNLSATFTPSDTTNYNTASAATTIAIAKVALTVQANNASKVYGEGLPAFTASGSGFVNGDAMSSLTGTLTFSTSATATSAPGTYSVTPSGVSSSNYTIAFASGTLTVNKASTSVVLTTSPGSSTQNQTVQLRAVVSAVAPGAGTPAGTVEFRDNGTLLGSATLVNGVATLNKTFKRGTHPLTATYTGSATFNAGSGSVNHVTQ